MIVKGTRISDNNCAVKFDVFRRNVCVWLGLLSIRTLQTNHIDMSVLDRRYNCIPRVVARAANGADNHSSSSTEQKRLYTETGPWRDVLFIFTDLLPVHTVCSFNSLRPSTACKHEWNRPPLVHNGTQFISWTIEDWTKTKQTHFY